MIRRVIGFLLILKAISPFLWLLAAYLFANAIVERFDRVSLRYSTELQVQLQGYDALLERIDDQIGAIEPTVQAAIEDATRGFTVVVGFVQGTIAQLKALPPIDLSNVMPELRFPAIRLPAILLDWKVPNVPIVREMANGIRNALQGVADGVNATFAKLSSAIGSAFDTALAPLRQQLVANVLRQLQPYLAAYARVSASLALIGSYYEGLERSLAEIQRQLALAEAVWVQIGADLADSVGLSVGLVQTVPENLGTAISESVTLLVIFALFSLALFLVFYWASMLRDLLKGWMLMTGRHEAWKRQAAEPRPSAVDRWLEKRDRARALETPS